MDHLKDDVKEIRIDINEAEPRITLLEGTIAENSNNIAGKQQFFFFFFFLSRVYGNEMLRQAACKVLHALEKTTEVSKFSEKF